MRKNLWLLTLTLALCAARCGVAQSAAPEPAKETATPLQQELHRLGEAASELVNQLPSFTCKEEIRSEALRGEKVEQSVSIVEKLRVVRSTGGKLEESFTFTEVNGKAFTEGGFKLPIYVQGGFDRALTYFLPQYQPCYRYRAGPGRIDFMGIDPAPLPETCKSPGTAGFALLDADGNITHVERRAPAAVALKEHMADFAAVDFAPVELNGHTYRLAHHLLAERPVGKFTGRFEATYTDCHLYSATVTLHSPDDSSAVHDAPPDSLPH